MKKIVIILGVLALLDCANSKGVCDAYDNSSSTNKKLYYLRKK